MCVCVFMCARTALKLIIQEYYAFELFMTHLLAALRIN